MTHFLERRILPRISPGSAIAACLLLMTAVIGASVAYTARLQDARQVHTEQQIVTSAINDATTKLGDALRPNTYWDDAYDNLADGVGADWAEKNLGPYARDTSGVSVLMVVSQSGKTLYSFTGDEPGRLAGKYKTHPAVKILVAQALSKTTAPPQLATGFVRVGERIYLAAASQIVPNDERAKAPLARHNVEVYLQAFGAARISKVQRDFQLSRVTLSTAAPPAGMAFVTLHDAAGSNIGYLWWRAARPGTAFAAAVAPFALSITLLIGVILWLVLRGWAFTLTHLEKQKTEAGILRQEIRAKTVFIGNISHELRTPLNAILGFSDIFTRQMFGPLGSANYREYAEHIHASGEALLSRINDVIELSSIEAHEKPLTLESTDAIFTIEDALETVRPLAAKRDVKLTLVRGAGPSMVITSVAALHEILARLLDNAIKFSLDDGAVVVLVESGADLVIHIRDQGIGMEPGLIPTLGKPFAQAGHHLSRSHGGLGLGLAICYGLAEALGIALAIESTSGVGTCVTLRMPLAGSLEVRSAA